MGGNMGEEKKGVERSFAPGKGRKKKGVDLF